MKYQMDELLQDISGVDDRRDISARDELARPYVDKCPVCSQTLLTRAEELLHAYKHIIKRDK